MSKIANSRLFELSLFACIWFLPGFAQGQTLISHDAAGNRSAEISNQPVTAPVIVGQPQSLLGQVRKDACPEWH